MAGFLKGDCVEVLIDPAAGGEFLSGLVSFVWRCSEPNGRRYFLYNVEGCAEGTNWQITQVPQEVLRRPNAARGKRWVIRSHSLNKRGGELR